LIDEAEIVLEKRTFERMTQNSWISGEKDDSAMYLTTDEC